MSEEKASTGQVPKVNLLRFTFESLYFCATPVETLRGERFRTAVNDWYMPFIRTGWAVPLSFVVDVGTLLQRPATGFRNRWKEEVRDEIKQLSLKYYKMLQILRRQPIFSAAAELLATTPDQRRRDEATRTFLRFLLAELSHFRHTYSFSTRKLKLLNARPAADGIRDLELLLDGKRRAGNMKFGDPSKLDEKNEFGAIVQLLQHITDYFATHPLYTFFSDEERLMVAVSARRPAGLRRVDYQFLQELLTRTHLGQSDEHEPRPQMVERVVPTDSYEVDGTVGGYIDVNRRRFSGSLAEILPIELALFRNRPLMYQKLLNEGALHFVRENIECIEEELRMLVCIVVDADERMTSTPEALHVTFPPGMNAYIRARALASVCMMDLARFIPRPKVHVDCALYLWSTKAPSTYRTEFDLFETWSAEGATDRFQFATELAAQAPLLFDSRLPADAEKENQVMDREPGQYIVNRSRARMYHCRHWLLLTSEMSGRDSIPPTDPQLLTSGASGDSLTVVCCDVHRSTLAVCTPHTLAEASELLRRADLGELSEERFRAKFLETVLLKAAGKPPRSDTFDELGDVA